MQLTVFSCVPLLAFIWTAPVSALEPRWMNGLQVQQEVVPGETAINGMSLRVSRVTGRDVPMMVQRIMAEWSGASTGPRPLLLRNGEWRVLSRIHRGRSEVVQWRAEPTELLWSEADLFQNPSSPERPSYLTAICSWIGPVHGEAAGTRFFQSTGTCRASVASVSTALEKSLRHAGWRIQRTTSGLSARHEDGHLQAVIAATRTHPAGGELSGGTAVVVVETRSAGARRQ